MKLLKILPMLFVCVGGCSVHTSQFSCGLENNEKCKSVSQVYEELEEKRKEKEEANSRNLSVQNGNKFYLYFNPEKYGKKEVEELKELK